MYRIRKPHLEQHKNRLNIAPLHEI